MQHQDNIGSPSLWATSEMLLKLLNLRKGESGISPNMKEKVFKLQLGMPTLIEFKTIEQNVDLCKELGLDFIELNMNLPICLPENLSHPFIRRALEMLAKFENFRLTWEVGHGAKVNFKEEVVFREYTDRIKHMHLHDCNVNSDHQPLYSGNVPINDRLLFAEKNDLSVVIEVKTSASLRESVEQIKKNYADLGACGSKMETEDKNCTRNA